MHFFKIAIAALVLYVAGVVAMPSSFPVEARAEDLSFGEDPKCAPSVKNCNPRV